MNGAEREPLWIPDSEVKDYAPARNGGGNRERVDWIAHGDRLRQNFAAVRSRAGAVGRWQDSLDVTGTRVFCVMTAIKARSMVDDFRSLGLRAIAAWSDQEVLVAASEADLERMGQDLDSYRSSGRKQVFDRIAGFRPNSGREKAPAALFSESEAGALLNLTVQLVPELSSSDREAAERSIGQQIGGRGGTVQQSCLLSGSIPLMQVLLPQSAVEELCGDSAVYSVDPTAMIDPPEGWELQSAVPTTLRLDPTVELSALPSVVVMDGGIVMPEPLQEIVIEHFRCAGVSGSQVDHGTQVGGKVAFGEIEPRGWSQVLTPRALLIDCQVYGNEPLSESTLIQCLEEGVKRYSRTSRIYVLSIALNSSVQEEKVSRVAMAVDRLSHDYGVQFVLCVGNHQLFQSMDELDRIIRDERSRLAPPAEAALALSVGAVVGLSYPGCISAAGQLAPYSRRGPGVVSGLKPDLVVRSAAICCHGDRVEVPMDRYSAVISPAGLRADAGTSFAAPTLAGRLAETTELLPEHDVLLAKAIVLHDTAETEEMAGAITAEEHLLMQDLYGRGVSECKKSLECQPNDVVMLRAGVMPLGRQQDILLAVPDYLTVGRKNSGLEIVVTCVTDSQIGNGKAADYIQSGLKVVLKKPDKDGSLKAVRENGIRTDGPLDITACRQRHYLLSSLCPGDLVLTLEPQFYWAAKAAEAKVRYAIVVSIRDLADRGDLNEAMRATNRYQALSLCRVAALERNNIK